jgi:hypothetical protein
MVTLKKEKGTGQCIPIDLEKSIKKEKNNTKPGKRKQQKIREKKTRKLDSFSLSFSRRFSASWTES